MMRDCYTDMDSTMCNSLLFTYKILAHAQMLDNSSSSFRVRLITLSML
jgi:hypothetical protein